MTGLNLVYNEEGRVENANEEIDEINLVQAKLLYLQSQKLYDDVKVEYEVAEKQNMSFNRS